VVNLESVNVADLDVTSIPERVEVVTIDVSYLSVSAAVAQLDRIEIGAGALLIALVKPMFELRAATAPNDRVSLDKALSTASAGVTSAGWEVRGSMDSPVTGSRGAREVLLHAVRR
jgi:23S rRNA (cytidine1920-2'-O)/16S rRNA (cytidine1409-2'-O)-methyltransferase